MEDSCKQSNPADAACDSKGVLDILWECKSGFVNNIYRIQYCKRGCKDGGEGKSDYCG